MGKIIKWAFAASFIVIVVALIAGYVILAGYDFNSLKPKISKAVQNSTGRELVIGGDIDLAIGISPSLVIEDIRFKNAAWGSVPDMVEVKRLEVKVHLIPLLSGDIAVERLILIEPEILIETDKSGISNLTFETGKSDKKGAPEKSLPTEDAMVIPTLDFKELLIQKGMLTYKDFRAGESHKVIIRKLRLDKVGSDSLPALDMTGSYNGRDFTVRGNLGPLKALADEKKPWSVDLTAEALGINLALKGTIKDVLSQKGLDIAFSIQVQDFAELNRFTGLDIPLPPPFKVSGRVSDPGPEEYRIADFKALLGPTGLAGGLKIDFSKKRPKVKGSFFSEKMDLRPLMARMKNAPPPTPEEALKPSEKVFSDTPLPLEGLSALDAELLFKAGRILTPQLAVRDLNLKIILKDGQLAIKPLTALIGGGNLEVTVDLVPDGKAATIQAILKIGSLDIAKMLEELKDGDTASGKLDMDLDLRGKGDSLARLMGSLNGKTILMMHEGLIRNRYLDLMGGDLTGKLIQMLSPAAKNKDYTVVNCLVNRFDIRNGVADATVLVFDTEQMSVVGEGNIDLGRETINLGIKPQPKKGLGEFGFSLGELAKPLRVGGTLAKPSLKLDTAQALTAIGKAVGGIALFGGVGIAASLVGKKGEKNLCEIAKEAAITGIKPGAAVKEKQPGQVVEETLKGIGSTLKGLFHK